MTAAWQNILVVAIVLAAIGYLGRVGWQSVRRRRAAACGSCPTCPAGEQEPAVVQIGASKRERTA